MLTQFKSIVIQFKCPLTQWKGTVSNYTCTNHFLLTHYKSVSESKC